MLWWGDGAGWGGLLVMILAMAGFWALVVGATMALFRGVHDDPVVRRRRSGAEADLSQARQVRAARGKSQGQDHHTRPELRSRRH